MADGDRAIAVVDIRQIADARGVSKRAVELRAKKEDWPYTEEAVLGGRRRLYTLTHLPADVQAAVTLAARKSAPRQLTLKDRSDTRIASAWARYESASEAKKARAQRAANALQAVTDLVAAGHGLMEAREQVAGALAREGDGSASVSALRRWAVTVGDAPRSDWPALLLPANTGRTATADCDAVAWDWYKGHYLTRAKPSHKETHRRLKEMADAQGWTIPSPATLARRMDAEVSRVTQVILREGAEAASRLLPAMQRDALAFAVGEAVNGDGLKFDRLWVKFEDGEIINTATAWFWQDVNSRRVLAWRLAKTENTDVFRLATYDLTGVCAPTHVWMDNTRVAANKLMTAGAKGRHRFKSDPEDGVGMLLMLGMEPHFTNPDKESGNPGAKPIERAFGVGGLHEMVATNPRIVAAGGYSKATAIAVQLLREVIAEEVARFNARTQRRTQACRGVLSFDQAWEAGVQQRPPRVLSEVQRRILLMSREVVTADKRNGELRIDAGRGPFGRNAYWCEHLPQHAGRKLVVHFDPDDLSAGAHVYSLDGRYLFAAEHIARGAFNDTQTGREWSKFRRRVAKANKDAAANEVRMDALERAALYESARPEAEPPAAAATDSSVIQGHFQRVPNPERDALPRTGTDDARESNLASLLERIQQANLKDHL